jgi:hypothetical protein
MIDAQLRGRLTLLTISALFIGPILLAMYLYFSGDAWRPAEHTERGNLILPPVTLPDITLDTDGGDYQFRSVWSLLVLTGDQCDVVCVESLAKARQIRLSLGPKMTRLQTVFLPADPAAAAVLDLALFPKLVIGGPEAAAIIRQLTGNWENGEIFLVDPLGNLMMSYPPGAEMGDVRKDLGQLLKLSGIG